MILSYQTNTSEFTCLYSHEVIVKFTQAFGFFYNVTQTRSNDNVAILFSIFREGTLLGLGNPLLDISATVESEYLEKNELGADNAILAEDKHKHIFNELQENYNADYIGLKCFVIPRLTLLNPNPFSWRICAKFFTSLFMDHQ